MSRGAITRAAARSNAEWCDAFCRTHGVVGRFHAALWSTPVRSPPLYPDAVTLRPEATVEQTLSSIDPSEGCGVKDSFATLELGAAGFQPVLRAEWLVREPAERRAAPGRWSRVTTQAALRDWETAWGEPPGGSTFFRPALLDDERVAVLAGFDRDRVAAGAIANRSDTVIGLSNVFDVVGDLESAWAAGAAAATRLWGELPIVSYDSGESLDAATRAGFESIGELVVWVNPARLSGR